MKQKLADDKAVEISEDLDSCGEFWIFFCYNLRKTYVPSEQHVFAAASSNCDAKDEHFRVLNMLKFNWRLTSTRYCTCEQFPFERTIKRK